MTRFYNPYQFIPVSKPDEAKLTDYKQIKDGQAPYIRHDRWEENALSGRIVCRLQTISPLVIGARQEETEEGKDGPRRVIPYRDGQALPANSLRGMVASVVESISNSAMRVLSKSEEHEYFVRKHYREPLKSIGLLLETNGEYKLFPLAENGRGMCRVNQSQLDASHRTYQRQTNQVLIKATLHNSWANLAPDGTEGVLYRRGVHDDMPGKKHETFIPWNGVIDEKKLLRVDDELIEQFNTEIIKRVEDGKHENFPYLPVGYDLEERMGDKRLVRAGDLLYFRKNGNGQVQEISYSAIWRKPVGNLYDSLKAIDENLLPWNSVRTSLTPAEALFGVIEKGADGGGMDNDARNLASRLRFHDAEAENTIELAEEEILLKILASPKAPSPSMYFRITGGGYISKQDLELPDPGQTFNSLDDSNSEHDSDHIPNGRKRYLPHPDWQKNINGKNKWESQHPDDNRNQKLLCRPIPDGTGYWFHIDFENLSADELDLLRRAITPAPEFQHQLGLGKPLGLGQVEVEEMGVFLIDRKQRYTSSGAGEQRYKLVFRKENIDWPERYLEESNTTTNMDGDAISVPGNPLINTTALRTLKQIGSPRYLANFPVCYPFHSSQSAYDETKGYEWFVHNDNAQRNQHLRAIEQNKQLPALDSDTQNWELHEPDEVVEGAIQLRLGGLKPISQRSYDDNGVIQAIEAQWPGTRVLEINLNKSFVELIPSDTFPQADADNWSESFPVNDDEILTMTRPKQ